MKIYEKPKLMVLSISANDALCGTCALQTRFDTSTGGVLLDFVNGDKNGNGIFDPDDAPGYFGTSESGCDSHISIGNYCKFTGGQNGETQLFTS